MDPLTFLEMQMREAEALGLPEERAPTALCLSGGGIRSATFCLGVMQALARLKLLDKFDYLSTVSGGGYIGGWFSAWCANQNPTPAMRGIEQPTAEPVRWLRKYSNYLSPRLGLFSADTWTLAAIYLRNLFLNWMILVPLVTAAVLLPWLVFSTLQGSPPRWLILACLGASFLLGAYSMSCITRWMPALGGRAPDEKTLVAEHILTMALAATLLTVGWFHLLNRGDMPTVWGGTPVYFAAFGFLMSSAGSVWGALRGRTKLGARVIHNITWEGWALILLVGTAAGLLLWWTTGGPLASLAVPRRDRLYLIFGAPILFGLLMLGAFLTVGLVSFREGIGDQDREWFARTSAWLLIVQAGWMAFSATVLYGPEVLLLRPGAATGWVQALWVAGTGTVPGFLAALAGWSNKTRPNRAQNGLSMSDKILGWVITNVAEKVLAPMFLFGMFAGVSWGVARFFVGTPVRSPAEYLAALREPSPIWVLAGAAAFCLTGYGIGRLFSVNRFSLNAMYRNRLIRAYLGASRDRNPDPLTGFDLADNLHMMQLAPRPFHILNLTLNITGGGKKKVDGNDENLAWQQRQARSFTVSKLYSGWGDNYQPSRDYMSQGDPPDRRGISLGTAVSVSGAAMSPNCGYHSSRLLTFVMAIFNLRLGAWFPNTNRTDLRTLTCIGPDSALVLLREMLGMTNDSEKWIYVSDGGHFENLGLYEMVRRRVPWIVACDCGADPKYQFEDVSNAIQKIRADFGYAVRFVKEPVLHNALDKPGLHCALLEVDYTLPGQEEQPKGRVLLIKPALSGHEIRLSRDVWRYREDHPEFPQQTTVDQFFDESQFESYRRLGEQSVELMAQGLASGASLEAFFDHVERVYLSTPLSLPEHGAGEAPGDL